MSSCSPEEPNHNFWLKNKKALNQVLFTMRLHSLTPKNPTQNGGISVKPQPTSKIQDFTLTNLVSDKTSLLSDEILLNILSRLPKSQRNSNFLVSKRWLNLEGRLMRSIKILDWDFLISGRLFLRFPNLIHVDLINGCLISPRNSGIVCTQKIVSFNVGADIVGRDWFVDEKFVLNADEIDEGLMVLANGCPNLRKLAVVNTSEMGLLSLAEECPTLQELELHMCDDQVLRGIAACQNLQILRLIGIVDGFYSYSSFVSDVGLTILAQGCKRLVKLELSGCKGSYEGIKAIGQCCQMLEELTLCDHRMEDGWLPALSYCENLKTLRFLSCKKIDGNPGLGEQLGASPMIDSLQLEKCQLKEKENLRALFIVCQDVKEMAIKNCWGLDDDMFNIASICRKLKCLSLEGCSLLTTIGLESAVISWKELESLKVISCNNVKDSEAMFSVLKDLTWKQDVKSLLLASLAGTGVCGRGGKFFKKHNWKSLPGV